MNKKNYTTIWVLLIIVVVMSVIKLTYKPNVAELAPQVAPTQTLSPTSPPVAEATPTTVYERNYDDYPLWDKLPYSGVGFIVDRYTAPLTLAIKAKGLDKALVKKAVEKWIGENGIDAMTHKLVITN